LFVLWQINHGRRLAKYDDVEDAHPTALETGPENVEDCHYYDRIAGLLAAGTHDGFDPVGCATPLYSRSSPSNELAGRRPRSCERST
jgi:hypothetical protein